MDMRLDSLSPEQAIREAAHDIGGEVRILLSFWRLYLAKMLLLIMQKFRKLEKEARLTKTCHFMKTKCLTIKSHVKSKALAIRTGTHESPRQHLRRGHIRRLESGNIWVNACVVGNSEKGVIKKSYNVAA